jgi:hypothetical protein
VAGLCTNCSSSLMFSATVCIFACKLVSNVVNFCSVSAKSTSPPGDAVKPRICSGVSVRMYHLFYCWFVVVIIKFNVFLHYFIVWMILRAVMCFIKHLLSMFSIINYDSNENQPAVQYVRIFSQHSLWDHKESLEVSEPQLILIPKFRNQT